MNTNTQQPTLEQQANLGLYFLKEAVSEVLFNAQNEEPLHPIEIQRRIGIPETDEPYFRSDTLISGILFLLKKDARVEEIAEKESRWKITDVGALRQRQMDYLINLSV